jgi:hypothetical protein
MKSGHLFRVTFLLTLFPIGSHSQSRQFKGQECYVNELDVPYMRVYGVPDMTGVPTGFLTPGSKFHVVDENRYWLKIRASDGREGWITSSLSICPERETRLYWARPFRIRAEDILWKHAGRGPLFVLSDNLRNNLEGFLRAEAGRRSHSAKGTMTEESASNRLTSGEMKAWRKCIDSYEDSSELNVEYFFFPDGVESLEDARTSIRGYSKREAIIEEAIPIYRKYWWFDHRKVNQAWVGTITPWLDRTGNGIADRTAKAFEIQWPKSPFVVIVRREFGPRSAFLAPDSNRILVVLTSATECQGFSAIELIFREASRVWASQIDARTKEAALKIGKKVPKDFVEILLSYTAGELTRMELEKAGVQNYQPLVSRSPSTATNEVVRALDKHWRAHLDGADSYEGALGAVLSEID